MIALSIYRFDIELNRTVQCEFKFIFDSTIHNSRFTFHSKFLSNVYSQYGFLWFPTNSDRDPIIIAFIISRFFLFMENESSEKKKTEFLTSFDKKRPSVTSCWLLFIVYSKWNEKKKCCRLQWIVCPLSIHSFIYVPLLNTQYSNIFNHTPNTKHSN